MLLESYRKEIFRPECNASFQSLHCIAHLEQDIGEVIPYLNSVLGGTSYTKDPPAVMFQIHGRLLTVHAKSIAINALPSEEEADKVLGWITREINETWERRAEITPRYEVAPKPQLLEIFKLLPKTNCRECGQPTCMVFASLVAQGVKIGKDCPPLSTKNAVKLEEYLINFKFIEI